MTFNFDKRRPTSTRVSSPYRHLSRGNSRMRVDKNAPRRDRVISKVLLRARRRWDLYADAVKANGLDGDESAKTTEWALIQQNKRLLDAIRHSEYLPERSERLATKRPDPVPLSKMRVHRDIQSTESARGSFGE